MRNILHILYVQLILDAFCAVARRNLTMPLILHTISTQIPSQLHVQREGRPILYRRDPLTIHKLLLRRSASLPHQPYCLPRDQIGKALAQTFFDGCGLFELFVGKFECFFEIG